MENHTAQTPVQKEPERQNIGTTEVVPLLRIIVPPINTYRTICTVKNLDNYPTPRFMNSTHIMQSYRPRSAIPNWPYFEPIMKPIYDNMRKMAMGITRVTEAWLHRFMTGNDMNQNHFQNLSHPTMHALRQDNPNCSHESKK